MTELTLAAALWGFGFVASVWALQYLSFPAVLLYRFGGAFLVGAFFLLSRKSHWRSLHAEFEISREAGFWLAATLILQTWGLITTTATKSAFITVLYVVFVPMLAAIFDREKLLIRDTFCLVLALVGTALVVNFDLTDLKLGDLLTLGNALAAAFQIRVMGKLAPKSRNHFAFNVFQCFWTTLFTLPLLGLEFAQPGLFHGGWSLLALDQRAWLGLLSLTVGSSLVAFYLQIRAQQHLSATVASLLFLMESPFSAIFAALLLHERMDGLQLVGLLIIFGACVFANLPKKLGPGVHP